MVEERLQGEYGRVLREASAPHRLRDLADVQDLIRLLGLPAEYAAKLDASVRGEYQRLWQTLQDTRAEGTGE